MFECTEWDERVNQKDRYDLIKGRESVRTGSDRAWQICEITPKPVIDGLWHVKR